MFSNLDVKDIFPTPLWIADLKEQEAAEINQRLRDFIYRVTAPLPDLPPGGTWQTDPYLHQHDDFAFFHTVIRKIGKASLDFLKIQYRDFVVTGCWANINPKGGAAQAHMHPNNFLGGVYYVAVPPGTGIIKFTDPRPQSILPTVETWNKYIGNEIQVDVKPGRFVLFPAWLVHSVPVNTTDDHRISVSFNLMFTDFTEMMSQPVWRKGSVGVKA